MSQEKTRIEIREDEVPTLLKVAICEVVLGFARETAGGIHTWKGPDLRTGEPRIYTVEELPEFAQDGSLAMGLFAKFATDHDYIPRLWIDNRAFKEAIETPVHVDIAERRTGGKQPKSIMRVSASNVPRAVCRAACDLYDIDMQALHRSLFPARYLVVVR